METATQTQTVGIAWRLLAPSDTGGKVYTIAVIGDTLVVGWGRRSAAGTHGPGSTVKVEQHPSHAAALAAAMERTIAKEAREYVMDIEPRRLDVTGKRLNGYTLASILSDGVTV